MKKVYFKDGKFFLYRNGKAYLIKQKGTVSEYPYGVDIREGAILVEGWKSKEIVQIPVHFKQQIAFKDFKAELKQLLKKPKTNLKNIANIVYAIITLKKNFGSYYTVKEDVFESLTLLQKKVIVKALVESTKEEFAHFQDNFKYVSDDTLLRIRRVLEIRVNRYLKVNKTLDKHLLKFHGLIVQEANKRGLGNVKKIA